MAAGCVSLTDVTPDALSRDQILRERTAGTSRAFRIPSGEMAKRYKEHPRNAAVFLPGVVAAQGALPIQVGDDVIGAIGVSGAPGGEKDEVRAKAGIAKATDGLK